MPVLEKTHARRTAELLACFLQGAPLCNRYTVQINGMTEETEKARPLSEICHGVYEKLTALQGANEDETNYLRNIRLKELLCGEFRNLDEHGKRELAIWIIRQWGGINRGFMNDGDTMECIMQDIAAGEAVGYDTISIASPISSRSKVLSFLAPERYAICDSRAVFSLNWLLFVAAQKNAGREVQLFKSLASGNRGVQGAGTPQDIARQKFPALTVTEAHSHYSEYCGAVSELTAILCETQGEDWKLYHTEMLLFALADTNGANHGIPYIVRELTDRDTDFSMEAATAILTEHNNGENE